MTTSAYLLALLAVLPLQQGIDRLVPPSPNPAGFIHDGGPVLAGDALAHLNDLIRANQAAGRGDIGVAILRDIGDYPPYEVGLAIYRAWKVGSVGEIGATNRNLGALLLIVPKELAPGGKGECWITTGTGAEGALTDASAATICREAIIPHLRDRDYAAAIEAGITAIGSAFAQEVSTGTPAGITGPPSGSPPTRHGTSPVGIIGGILAALGLGGAGIVGIRWRKRNQPRPCPRGHGPMRRLDEAADDAALQPGQRTEESLKSVDYDVWECPTCGERLVLRYKRLFTSYSQCPTCSFWTVKSRERTIRRATTLSEGIGETTKTCKNCGWTEATRHTIARVSSSSGSSFGGGSSSGGGSSFGGSGSSAGGGGGSSY